MAHVIGHIKKDWQTSNTLSTDHVPQLADFPERPPVGRLRKTIDAEGISYVETCWTRAVEWGVQLPAPYEVESGQGGGISGVVTVADAKNAGAAWAALPFVTRNAPEVYADVIELRVEHPTVVSTVNYGDQAILLSQFGHPAGRDHLAVGLGDSGKEDDFRLAWAGSGGVPIQ